MLWATQEAAFVPQFDDPGGGNTMIWVYVVTGSTQLGA